VHWRFALLILAGALAGCDQTPATQLVIPIEPDAQQPKPEGGMADVTETEAEAGQDAHDAATVSAAVIVGLGPTPQVAEGGTGAAEQLDAVLLSMASGARGLTLAFDWEALDGTGAEAEAQWDRLEAMAGVVRTHKRALVLTVRAVDTTQDRRPSALKKLAWDSSAVTDAMHALLGRVFSTLGPELRYLSLGFEVDRYVEANPLQGDAFKAFALDAVQFANTHPNRQSSRTGVTWSMRGWAAAEPPRTWAPELLDASDMLMVSYAPMTDTYRATPSDAIPADLDQMLFAAEGKPLVITELGYPSSDLIGSSEDAQAEFVGRLLQEVTLRRNAVSFVGWGALHDPAPAWCQARAAACGHPDSLELYVYWCSTGLRTRQGSTKPSFDEFRAGAAGLMDP
jgi:hypothetical protein